MTAERRPYPFTSSDLRDIADRVEEIENAFPGEATDIPADSWLWGLSVEVLDEGDQFVGHVRPYGDGWLGFYPLEVSDS